MEYVQLGLLVLLIILFIYNLISIRKRKNQLPEMDAFKDVQNDLKVYLQKEYGDFRYQLSQMINETGKSSQKDLNEFKDNMLRQIEIKFKEINDKVDVRLGEGFDKTNKTFTDVVERLTKIDEAQKKIETLSTEVISLNDLLKGQKTRGIFGEVQLYQLLSAVLGDNAELYEKQKTLSNGSIADAIIYAPEPIGMVAVDSKFPLENYRRMVDRELGDADRLQATKDFKRDVKKHIDDIKNKYIIFNETGDQAFMFVPAEAIFAEISAYHEDLIEYATKNKVWLVSPTTLISTLSMIQMVVKNLERDRQAKVIVEELKKLGEEFKRYVERWDKLKRSIETVAKTADSVHTTSTKISRKFEHISEAKFNEIESDEPDLIESEITDETD
ncbi:MAG: DNA recombination protein RmuC [Acholeplasmataceae bacterium]|nr:DNA recombination protein RmuC [Acholeplasmataceae bacterium]